MTSSCEECGHSILSHRNGQCPAIVQLPPAGQQMMMDEMAPVSDELWHDLLQRAHARRAR